MCVLFSRSLFPLPPCFSFPSFSPVGLSWQIDGTDRVAQRLNGPSEVPLVSNLLLPVVFLALMLSGAEWLNASRLCYIYSDVHVKS
jgi:hypothetical protein